MQRLVSILNVPESTIGRESDAILPTLAGPEIGVASTKAFTAQMIALYLFSMYLGELRGTIDETLGKKLAQDLAELPLKIEQLLNEADSIEELSKEFSACRISCTSAAASISRLHSKVR